MFKTSFLLPTARDRFIDVMRTWDYEQAEFLISYELDNPNLRRLTYSDKQSFKGKIIEIEHKSSENGGGIVRIWNQLGNISSGECLAIIADDLWNLTEDWQSLILKKCPEYLNKAYAVVGNDLLISEQMTTWERKLAGHPFVSRRYFQLFGYIWNPIYRHFYCDNEFFDIGNGINRLLYIPEFRYDNRHCFVGKCSSDIFYERMPSLVPFAEGKYFFEIGRAHV